MTTADAKKVLEMLSIGEDRILKENVFEIIDMIDQPSTISIPSYPHIPNVPCPNTDPWKITLLPESNQQRVKVTLATVDGE